MAFTSMPTQSGLARSLFIALFLCLLLLGYALIRYRGMLVFSGAGLLFAGLLLALFIIFAAYAFVGREVSEGFGRDEMWAQRQGVNLGLLVGLFWLVEVIVDDMLPASSRISIIGAICLVCVIVLGFLGGIYGARHTGSFKFGLRIGLWSGMLGALLSWIALLLLTYVLLGRLQLYPQYSQGFAHSGEPDIATYIVKNAVFVASGHLLLGPVLGLAFGALGVLIGRGRARA